MSTCPHLPLSRIRHFLSPPDTYEIDIPLTRSSLRPTPTEIWGNFIIHNDPSIPEAIADGARNPKPSAPNPASAWARYTTAQPYFINLNQTGGQLVSVISPLPPLIPVNEYEGTGLRNNFTLADAYTWEGGRGVRCDFWKSVGEIVPE